MIIYDDKRLRVVTLIINIHNRRDIVVGADALATFHDASGKPIQDARGIAEKILRVNSKAALSVSGFLRVEVFQFLKDFAYNNKGVTDFDTLFQVLIDSAASTLTPDERESYQLTLAGFADKKPIIKTLRISATKRDVVQPTGNYTVYGYDEPVKLAASLLDESKVSENPPAGKLKAIVASAITEAIAKYPDILGGVPEIKVLHGR
jgi:hypothetical protein